MSEDKNTNPVVAENSEEKVSRWDKIKAHVKRNEDRYTSFAAGVVTSAVLFGLNAHLNGHGKTTINGDVVENVGGGNAHSNIENVVAIDSPITIDQTTNVINNFGGHMVKLVKCMESGEIFGSVTEAAEAAGVGRSAMSKHINGHTDHIFGKEYRIVGLGTTT